MGSLQKEATPKTVGKNLNVGLLSLACKKITSRVERLRLAGERAAGAAVRAEPFLGRWGTAWGSVVGVFCLNSMAKRNRVFLDTFSR